MEGASAFRMRWPNGKVGEPRPTSAAWLLSDVKIRPRGSQLRATSKLKRRSERRRSMKVESGPEVAAS